MGTSAPSCDLVRTLSLYPVRHSARLTDPAKVAALYRGLGQVRASLRGFHTTDRTEIERLVAAIDPPHESTCSFARGTLAATELEALVRTEGYGYLDLRTATAVLRVWPASNTWSYSVGTKGPAESWSLAEGLARFQERAPDGAAVTQGFVNRLDESAKPALLAFLLACGVRVNVVLDLELDAAVDLASRVRRHHDWQAGGVLVDQPSGKVHGFLMKGGAEAQAEWRARVTRALEHA